MKANSLIKDLSREQLSGKWLKLALMNLGVIVVTGLLYNYLGIFGEILAVPILLGSLSMAFHVANSEELNFSKFIVTKGEYIKYLIYSVIIALIQMAITLVGGLVLGASIIPVLLARDVDAISGIFSGTSMIVLVIVAVLIMVLTVYVGLLYAMAPMIILMNREDIDGISVMRCSRNLIKGHMADLFILQLSFIGWAILSIISCGIGFLFLKSYYETALVNFFFELIKEEREKAVEMGIIDNSIICKYRVFDEDETSKKDDVVSNVIDAVNEVEKKDEDAITVEKLTTVEGFDKKDN